MLATGRRDRAFLIVLTATTAIVSRAALLLGAALRSGVVAWPRSGRHGADLALILVAAGLTIPVGAAWELVEFACDSFFGADMAQGYDDTIRDLIADAADAVTGAVLAVRSWPRR